VKKLKRDIVQVSDLEIGDRIFRSNQKEPILIIGKKLYIPRYSPLGGSDPIAYTLTFKNDKHEWENVWTGDSWFEKVNENKQSMKRKLKNEFLEKELNHSLSRLDSAKTIMLECEREVKNLKRELGQ